MFLGVVITQEDLNSKFLRSLPPEWNTHVVVWMNKANIETISLDDLYNNFKIVEQDVKKSVGASSGAQNLAFMPAPSTSSTNDVNIDNPAYEVSTVSPNINTACLQVSTANFSDNTVYAFMVENPNGSNLLQQDLEQIHEDDLEAMDLKWQLSLLSMRAKRYFQRAGNKIFINANDTSGYDKSKVACFNCHKMVHFAKECRAPRNKEGQFKYQDNTRKQGNNENTSSKAMLAIDGVGFHWSDIAKEQVQKNMALMAFSDSEVYNDKLALIVKLNQTEFTTTTYKRGLATIEEQLITYRKNEVLFSEEVAVLKREVACKDYEINVLKSEFEKVKQEKEGIEFKIEKFDNASKSLDKLLGSQITDKSKKGLGYNVVPPPYPLIYNRPKKLDLSYSGLDEFKDPEFKSYGSEDKQVSEDTSSFVESSLNVDKETVFLVDKKIEFVKPKNHEKPVKKSVRLSANTIKGKGWYIEPKSHSICSLWKLCLTLESHYVEFFRVMKINQKVEALLEELLQFKLLIGLDTWDLPLERGIEDPNHPDKVYKVVKALYGLHQAPRAWYETLANYLLCNGFKRGKIDQTLFIKKQKRRYCWLVHLQQKEDGIFISQDKYVAEILKKFNYTDVKSALTPVDLEKPLVKDGDADDVDLLQTKTSHLLVVKRIFRYLKGKPTLGLWYSRDYSFDLVAYTDSDYAGATQDRKSTTEGCQFLGNRLISWQCKKKTMVATSTIEV
ncbi:putative ribonuclease H-like domain-containing protein [Tanacetum coccineum]|uniref:Ribonuclease H-like domain-containing protein n=1 Tax=Tanacetum coccineum TaxID=301880 RepID=A0ABQ5BZH5_9ASTR